MTNEIVLVIFYFFLLIYSIIIHEVSHGVAALWLGDPTAKYAGRLNLNPLKHIDPYGSILVPILMYYFIGFAFGWAKPVPYNPYNLKDQKWGPVLVALGGPLANITVALIFAFIARMDSVPAALKLDILANIKQTDWATVSQLISQSFGSIVYALSIIIIFWNVLLAFFNLIPIPPLDGSKLLYPLLNLRIETMAMLEQFGFVFLLIFILLFGGFLGMFLNLFWNLFFGLTI